MLYAICFWPLSSSRPPTTDSQRARTALQALQTVLVPSCSLWPARYIKLVKNAPNHRSGSRIIIPLSMLLQDVCDGIIELRDPLYDLEDLIHGGVCAYGCSMHLSVDYAEKSQVSICALTLEKTVTSNTYMLILEDGTKSHDGVQPFDGAVTNVQDIDGLIHLLATARSPSTDHRIIINLNSYPLRHLATIQAPKGSHTTLAFTSLSNQISLLSTTHILCTIPFLAHRLPHRLSDVLATVNNTRHFNLSTLTSTSTAYADILAKLSTKLTYDPVARQQCVDELGIKGWRTRRLMLEFEAALVRRGWLERWNVVLEAR
ncbi:hypothetical protein EDB19DRAFT_1634285 [Suillus lakei]|nr:hypothetical protein EDB19DRAFT_1634285 [Suillus lakei]